MAKKNKKNKKITEIENIEIEEEFIEDEEDIEEIEIDDDEEIIEQNLRDLSIEDRIINIENRTNIILVVVIITAILSLLAVIFTVTSNDSKSSTGTNTNSTNNNANSGTATSTYSTSAFKEISAADIKTESTKETIVFWIGRQGCSACTAYQPIIEKAGEDFGIQIRYIDLGKIVDFTVERPYVTDNNSYQTLIALTGSGEWKEFVSKNISGTPLTVIVKNNKVVGGIYGADSLDNVEKAFTNAGLKKK